MKRSCEIKSKKMQISKRGNYKKDLYAWTREQMIYLKNQEFNKLDTKHLFEELEYLGGSEKSAIDSYLTNMLMHMLKIEFQPTLHGRSWDLTIKNCKIKIAKVIRKNPSLKNYLKETLQDCYQSAILDAAIETGLDENIFPKKCPWKNEEIL